MPQQVQLLGQGLEQRFVPIPLDGCTPSKGYTNIKNLFYFFILISFLGCDNPSCCLFHQLTDSPFYYPAYYRLYETHC